MGASGLTPGAIVTAARADLKRWARKREDCRADKFAPYAFHRDHVEAARDAEELIKLALGERDVGLASGKPMTRLLYADVDTLQAAWAIACGVMLRPGDVA
jgi:hypothetical protein